MIIALFLRLTILFLLFLASAFLHKMPINLPLALYFLGGFSGLLLAESDRLLYIFFVKPQELSSQRASHLFKTRKFIGALKLLKREESSMQNLIFHTAYFQILFLILSFYIATSSGSLFGIGLSLGILFSTIYTQFWQILKTNTIKKWFEGMDLNLRSEYEAIYWLLITFIFLFILFIL